MIQAVDAAVARTVIHIIVGSIHEVVDLSRTSVAPGPRDVCMANHKTDPPASRQPL